MVNQEKDKKFIMIFGMVFVISLFVFVGIFLWMNHRFKATADIGLLTINTTESMVPNESYQTAEASFSQDKTINQIVQKEEIASGVAANVTAAGTVSNTNSTSESVKKEPAVTTAKQKSSVIDEPEAKKELSFMAPVVGEIITDFADESLVYSKTLDEWTTHLGIDIKANKTSSVVASEAGTVKAIKNDPRYGLTVIISHEDGFETIYANLLAADFVKEGDKVSKNQTIGTVGESASFEISDPPHLHFEILKNGENVNPTTLIR